MSVPPYWFEIPFPHVSVLSLAPPIVSNPSPFSFLSPFLLLSLFPFVSPPPYPTPPPSPPLFLSGNNHSWDWGHQSSLYTHAYNVGSSQLFIASLHVSII